jgi:hypothetical protein
MLTPFPIQSPAGITAAPNVVLPREVEMLAGALARIHGHVNIRREKGGLQIMMACPECLQRDGKKELSSRHLAVNAERNLGLGKYAMQVGQYNADYSGFCMKHSSSTGKGMLVSDLLVMVPLKERGYPDAPLGGITRPAPGKCLIPDGKGNMIPDHPGEVISLLDLPSNHPAVEYLVNRGFDIKSLTVQFRVAYCVQEAPKNEEMGRYYRALPCGFKDTPQNRIIFYADMQGVQRNWQARIIEKVVGDIKYFLHPYQNDWMPIQRKNPSTGEWEVMDHVKKDSSLAWKPQKYKSAFSSERNNTIMGLDAAIRWNRLMRLPKTLAIITEGPGDAGRFGPPGVCVMGRFLADAQARILLDNFQCVLYAGQNAVESRQLGNQIEIAMVGRAEYAAIYPPEGTKDVGDMTTEAAWAIARAAIKQHFKITL